ncbi:hypothetical protein Tco_0629297 [Tanacetum coccineum]|uniref:Uncharacterized protein n=1 Tax=Tanacetum coccineum TaxID=301880 RepID=A0ABQ4WSY3_9ASTR
MHIYWASVFILPTRVLLNIDQLMRQFLWCHGSSSKGKSKVAWEIACLPKHEGGLGIRRLECFNSALMTLHIWKLLTLKESLWLRPIIRKIHLRVKIGKDRNKSIGLILWADFDAACWLLKFLLGILLRSGIALHRWSKIDDALILGVELIFMSLMPIMKGVLQIGQGGEACCCCVLHIMYGKYKWELELLSQKGKRSPDQIVECIKSSVRLKLLSCKLKKSKNGERLARLWDLPEAVFK